jgi:hypothetical protein
MRYIVTVEAKVYETLVVSVEGATTEEASQSALSLVKREFAPGALISAESVKIEEDAPSKVADAYLKRLI